MRSNYYVAQFQSPIDQSFSSLPSWYYPTWWQENMPDKSSSSSKRKKDKKDKKDKNPSYHQPATLPEFSGYNEYGQGSEALQGGYFPDTSQANYGPSFPQASLLPGPYDQSYSFLPGFESVPDSQISVPYDSNPSYGIDPSAGFASFLSVPPLASSQSLAT